MAFETYTTPGGTRIRTPVCRRCGRAFPLTELVNGLCVDGNRYGGQGCWDEDEETSARGQVSSSEEVLFGGESVTLGGDYVTW